MKPIIITILLGFFFSTSALSQSFDCSNLDIYACSFEHYISNFYKKSQIQKEFIYLEYDKFITDKIPQNVLGIKITQIDEFQISKLLKKQKKIPLLAVRPMRLVEGNLTLSIIKFEAKLNNKKLEYINSGGMNYRVTGDCKSNLFHIIEVSY
jgi:hypothetical protein